MNVIFHTSAAIGVATLLTDTSRMGVRPTLKQVLPTSLCAFAAGIITHGVLDFTPHCYPINSRLDVIAGLSMIVLITWLANPHYRVIIGLAFLGSILPDLVDLGPKILNKQFNLGRSMPDNIFPWHWVEYSGSIYAEDCKVSTLNHALLFFALGLIFLARRTDFKNLFKRELR